MLDNNCFRYEKFTYKNYLFKNIDATYIIHLEGNNRINNIIKQISQIHITKELYILYNKGYRKCKKEDYINKPPIDLIDAFIEIFKDYKKKNYDNILILEDDFLFNDNIRDINTINNIDDFLIKNSKKEFIYYLGCIPYLQIKTFNYHNNLLLSTGTHACIYSKKIINKILNIDKKKINDWDCFLNFKFNCRYSYYKPICYQIFSETENKKYWDKTLNIYYIIIYLFSLLKLDKKPEPGFTLMYYFSIIFFYLLIFILFLFIYFIINSNKKFIK